MPLMTERAQVAYSSAIISIRVCSRAPRVVYVITENPSLTNSVREWVHLTDETISVVWLTSIASARRRMGWGDAATVFVENFAGLSADSGLIGLRSEFPDTRVLVLGDDEVLC